MNVRNFVILHPWLAAIVVVSFLFLRLFNFAHAEQSGSYIYEVSPSGWQCGMAEPAANIVRAKFEPENSTGMIRVTVAKCDESEFNTNGTIRLIQDDTGDFKNYEYRTSTTNYSCGDIVEFRLLPRNNNFELRGTMRKCDGSEFASGGKMYIAADGNIIAGPEDYLAGNSSESIEFTPLQLNSAGRHTYRAYLQSDNNSPGDYIISGPVDGWEEYNSYLTDSWQVQAGQKEVSFLFDPVALGITGDWHKYQVHVYPSGQDYPIRSGIISARNIATPDGDQFEPDNDFGQAKAIATNGSGQTHTIHVAGDEDWVQFEAQNGYQYVLTTSNLQGGANTLIGLFWDENNDNHADLIVSDDDGGGSLTSRIVWTSPRTGTHYVKVRDVVSNRGGANVSYSLQIVGSAPVQQGDVFEPDNDFGQATPMATDSSQSHTIHTAGDEDWVIFEALNGRQYVITTSNLQGGADTLIGLFWDENNDNHADLIISDDDGGGSLASRIVWTAPRTSMYFVKVRDVVSDRGGANVSYSLQISRIAPLPSAADTIYLPLLEH